MRTQRKALPIAAARSAARVREVWLAPEADAVLDRLWRDGQEQLVGRIEDAIDLIAGGDKLARRHRLSSSGAPEGLWLIAVRTGDRTWVIVWSEVSPGRAKVHGISTTRAF